MTDEATSPMQDHNQTTGRIPYFVFINYGADDGERAVLLHDVLRQAGYNVWMDRKALEGSDNWKQEIDRALRQSFVMISVLTRNSVMPEREWVHYEQRQAFELFLPIVPLLFEDCQLPERLKRINYIDFRNVNVQDPDNKSTRELMTSIEKHVLRQGEKLFDEIPRTDRHFIGRGDELRNLHRLIIADDLDAAQSRPAIAIHGLAGSGKTMMLNELTRRLGRRYPGGVIYEQRGETGLSAQAVLNRWMAQASGSRPDADLNREVTPQAVRYKLGQFGEMMVAFNDVWAEDFAQVQELMEALPIDTTTVLTTQFRDEAAAIGCQIFPIDHPLEKMNDADALVLLKDRLRGKGPLPSEEILTRLVHAVDGHPLALEISAGRCQSAIDLEEITNELTNDLREGVSALRYPNLLNVNANTSVTMSFDRSIRSLEASDTQSATTHMQAFRALGVFPDNVPLTRDAIGASWDMTLGQSRALNETLGALTDRALVIRNESASSYRVPALVGAYARELLHGAEGEYTLVRERYVRYIIAKATETFARPQDQWDQDESYVRQIAHIGRMLAEDLGRDVGQERFSALNSPVPMARGDYAVGESVALGALDLTCSFVMSILPLVRERPELGSVVVSWLESGLVSARLLNDEKRATILETELGAWHGRHSQYAQALAYLSHAVETARHSEDRQALARALCEQGAVAALRNEGDDARTAIKLHEEALTIQREVGQPEDIADTLLDLGRDYWVLVDGDKALELYEEAARINPRLSPAALNHIGSAHFVKANYDSAITYFREGLDGAKRVGSLRWEAENSNDLGAASLGNNEYEEAKTHLLHAIELYAKVGDRRVESISYGNLAGSYRKLERLEEAITAANKGIEIALEIGAKNEEARALNYLALTYMDLHHVTEARNTFEKALQVIEEARIDDRRTRAGVLGNYGWLLFTKFGDRRQAEALTRQALQLLNERKLPSAQTFLSIGELQRRLSLMRPTGLRWPWQKRS